MVDSGPIDYVHVMKVHHIEFFEQHLHYFRDSGDAFSVHVVISWTEDVLLK